MGDLFYSVVSSPILYFAIFLVAIAVVGALLWVGGGHDLYRWSWHHDDLVVCPRCNHLGGAVLERPKDIREVYCVHCGVRSTLLPSGGVLFEEGADNPMED